MQPDTRLFELLLRCRMHGESAEAKTLLFTFKNCITDVTKEELSRGFCILHKGTSKKHCNKV